MTVASNNYLPLLYPGDGHTVAFAFTWPIFADTDLLVRLFAAGVLTTLVEGADYTVDANSVNTPTGGGITLAVAPAVGESLIVSRAVPNNQQLSLGNSGPYLPQDLEKEFDRVILLTQQLAFLIASSLKLPANLLPAAFDPTLPAVLPANTFFKVNGAGNGIAVGDAAGQNALRCAHAVTDNYLVPANIDVVICSLLASDVILPPAAAWAGRHIYLKCVYGGTPPEVTVTSQGGLIDGVLTAGITGGQSIEFISDGADWWVFGKDV